MPSRRLTPALLAALLAGCGAEPTPPRAAAKGDRPPAASASASGGARPAAGTAKGLDAEGLRALAAGDPQAAVRRFEQALAADPTDRTALGRLALLAQDQAMALPRPQNSPYYLKSAGLIRRLRAAHPGLAEGERRYLPTIFYNEACTLAIEGEGTRAVAALAEAADAGFDGLETIDSDAELDSLRRRNDFRALMARLERRRVLALLAASPPAPIEVRLDDPAGKSFSLAGLRGKVVVVAVGGTWCPPCRKLAPHLARLYRRYHDKGLEVVGLNFEVGDRDEARKAVAAFVKAYAIPYPCVVGDESTRNALPRFAGFPTTLFVDRAGKVRLSLPGYQPPPALEAAAEVMLEEGKASAK